MIFSSAEYPLFLLCVFFLFYGLQYGRSAWMLARTALFFLLGDLVYLLFARDVSTLWDPIGVLVFRQLSSEPSPVPSFSRLAIGTIISLLSIVLGKRGWRAFASELGQSITALLSMIGMLVIGVLLLVLTPQGQLPAMTAIFHETGHLIYLIILGAAIGASSEDEGRPVGRLLVLFLVSSIFYHAWSVAMPGAYKYLLLLILFTIVLDYYLALWIDATETPWKRKFLVIVSLVSNLGILCVFKYFDFFLGSLVGFVDLFGANLKIEPFALILPAGISFHTFQSLSYTIDVYKRQIKPTRSVLEFATFVLLFPQLVAGPIVRAHEFMPQLAREAQLESKRAAEGLFRILVGLIKKVAVADLLALQLVDRVFQRPELFSGLESLLAVYGYAFQIYLDFSAYSDIAIGSAILLGFEFPENFRTPYRSADIQEFWRRWHMTLSSWLRDYLYISLGGSRGKPWFTYRNLIITMLLGGLWHGANWTFIVWGALHGGGLAVTRIWQRQWEVDSAKARRAILPIVFVSGALCLLHIYVLSTPLRSLAESRGIDPAWLHLIWGWLYLTPCWAVLTAWLSAGKVPTLTVRQETLSLPRGNWAAAHPLGTVLALFGLGGLVYSSVFSLFGIQLLSLLGLTAGLVVSSASLARVEGKAGLAAPVRAIWFGVSLLLLTSARVLPLWQWLFVLVLWYTLSVAVAATQIDWKQGEFSVWCRWAVARAGAIFLTFHYVCFAWVFFRATSFENARQVLAQIGTLSGDSANLSAPFLMALALGAAAHSFPDLSFQWLKQRFVMLPPFLRALVCVVAAIVLAQLANTAVVPFIYFQF